MKNYYDILTKQEIYFNTNKTKNVSCRINALDKLKEAIRKYESEIIRALNSDLNKSEFEAYTTEIGILYMEINHVIRHLKTWSKPEKVKTPFTHLGTKGYIYAEPYGRSLIISPWNYPFQLAVAPLIGAIAAGNCVVIKPSELTPNTSRLVKRLINETFDEEYIAVIEGGVETSKLLLESKFEHIFFTGSVPVGKIVMEAAAKHLTPITLELGGKSPCIVHEDATIKYTAKRIAWGKYTNAGQTCVAPDYLYVHNKLKQKFLSALKEAINELYGKEPLKNKCYTHIVNRKHFDRLTSLLAQGKIEHGGKVGSANLVIEPTVITEVGWGDKVMEDEIFGPILPILFYDDIEEVVQKVNSKPKPLALYLFSENKEVQDLVMNRISFGGGCVNDTMYHLSSPYLPFGGVGTSGIGSYHGKASFDTFSHKKSVMKQTTQFDIPFRYPNVKNALKKIKFFLK